METWNDEYRMGEPAAVYQVAEVKERVNPEAPLLERATRSSTWALISILTASR